MIDLPAADTLVGPASERATALAPRFDGPLLLATDGSSHADGAAALAIELRRLRHIELQVLTVLEPATTVPTSRTRHERIEAERRDRRAAAVREQLARLGGDEPSRGIDLADGAAVATIAAAASERGASLVVLGLHSHGFLDRVFHDETTLRVLRRVRAPVLAVTPSVRTLPERALVAVDFGAASIAAARTASRVLADGATLRLLHVAPQPAGGGDADAFDAAGQLALIASELEAEWPIRVECVVRQGPMFAELEHELRDAPAELVALGCRRCATSTPGRLASSYVRSAAVSLLVAPGGAPTGARSRNGE